jgi:signal transduction histidine kinase
MIKRIPFEYRITIIYIILGAIWILFSDQLVVRITSNPQQILMLSTYKGWFYVLVTGILLFFLVKKEINRRTIIYNQLLEVKKRAVESDNLKTAFLSNLSHYIRSPMNSILGFVELLEDKDLSPLKHQLFLSYVNERSHHLLQTLNSIVEISKIQEGLAEVENKKFLLNSLINNAVVSANLDLNQKKKTVTIKTAFGFDEGNDEIFSDRTKIFQILVNLLSNAINFTEQGEIEIGYSHKEDNLEFYVKDTGRGVPLEKQASLFAGFMYNSTSNYTLGEGVGLGLHLSSGLAKLLGGKLWLKETSCNGSIFCLSIPCSFPIN